MKGRQGKSARIKEKLSANQAPQAK